MNILILIKNENYITNVLDVLKGIYEKEDNKILYISLSRPYKSLVSNFFSEHVDKKKFIVLDTITKRLVPNPKEAANCIYVSSPTAFTEIFEVLDGLFKKIKFDNVVFDSLSSLAIYSKEDEAVRFVHDLISRVSILGNCEGSFLCLKSDLDSYLVNKVSIAVDKVIDLTKDFV